MSGVPEWIAAIEAAGGNGAFHPVDVMSRESIVALRDVTLDVEEGEFICFLGPSGCGKTTLLRAIAGLEIQNHGRIFQAGRDISAREAEEIGLVSRTVPDEELLDTALDLADRINGWSTQGVQLTKRMMWAGLETGSLATAVELESHTQLFVRMTTKNFEEAVLARKEGRKPRFED